MRAAGVKMDALLSKRVYDAMFQGFLKRQVGGSMQVLNDLKLVREFLANPALMAVMEAPGFRNAPPQACATRLIASVVPLVNTISSGLAAPM